MTIWILTIVLLLSLAGLGYRQGAIRVAFSLLGITVGALLAVPLGHLLSPMWKWVGFKNPAWLWVLGPVTAFFIVSSIFKSVALVVHRKVYIHYKQGPDEILFIMWERMNRRLGLCLGLVNGAVYLILISFLVYGLGYWTVQMSVSSQDPKGVRLLNRLANDLQSTGMAKVARSVDAMPDAYYDAADIVGFVYANPLRESLLSRYPGFLSLAERQEFQDLGNDPDYLALRLRQPSIAEVLQEPKVKVILNNPELLKTIWNTMIPNLKDLRTFLETGVSANYTEKILGHWDFNLSGSMLAYRKARPTMTPNDIKRMKSWMAMNYAKTTFMAGPDHLAILKGFPKPQTANAQTIETEKRSGEWKSDGSDYILKMTSDGKTEETSAEIDGERLKINVPGLALAFTREE